MEQHKNKIITRTVFKDDQNVRICKWSLDCSFFLYREMDFFKSCARVFIEQSDIRNEQHDLKSVNIECRIVLFLHDMREKSTHFAFSIV